MFALVDCNSCYASCEQIFRPDLRGKPIVVLSNNDGCIVARNNEAKALDIPDLQPYFKIKHLLAKNQVNVFSSNYELYGDISKRIMQCLTRFTNNLEVYSIDEAFLHIGGMHDYRDYGLSIKHACWKEQRMPVCVGIAPTKTLAKLANHIAKKSIKLNGVCVIKDTQQWEAVFRRLPVKKVWGIGSRIALRLEFMNINTVEDLRLADINLMRKEFGVVLERTIRELNGEACLELIEQPPAKQQIISSRSFGQKITTLNSLQEAVASHTSKAAYKLRQQQSFCQQLSVTLETSRFTNEQPLATRVQILPYPTNDTRLLISAADTLCQELYQEGKKYSKAGICLTDFCSNTQLQTDLFATKQDSKSSDLMQVLDKINQRYGKEHVFIAKQGVNHQWQMQRAFKSPSYTTRLKDLPLIRL